MYPAATGHMAVTPSRLQGSMPMRYPSPFFDIASTWYPRTIRELLQYCRVYFYTQPLIAATLSKLARYSVTDVVVTHKVPAVTRNWEWLIREQLKFRSFLTVEHLEILVHGNCFCSLIFPTIRHLMCTSCGNVIGAKNRMDDWNYQAGRFMLLCPKCKHKAPAKVIDVPIRSPRGIRLHRWDPMDIIIDDGEYPGTTRYLYRVPRTLANSIRLGKKQVVSVVPLEFLEAVEQSKSVILDQDNFRHIKREPLAGRHKGWGMPLIAPVLKYMFYLQIMMKTQECVAPWTLIDTSKGLVPAKDVKVGDQVRTHLGRLMPVAAKRLRPMIPERGDYAVQIALAGTDYPASTFSNNHPLLVSRADGWCWVQAGEVVRGDRIGCPVGATDKEDWSNIQSSEVASVAIVPCSEVISFEIDQDHTFCTPGIASHNTVLTEMMVPMRIVFPQAAGPTSDPYSLTWLEVWKRKIESEIRRWRTDPNYISVVPLPVGSQSIGGEGRSLMLGGEIRMLLEQIIAALEVPMEFVFSGTSYTASMVSLRQLENLCLTQVEDDRELLRWIVDKCAGYLYWTKPSDIHFKPFKSADDLARKQFMLALKQNSCISGHTLDANIDVDYSRELEIMKEEALVEAEINKIRGKVAMETQGEAAVTQAKYQVKAQAAAAQQAKAMQQGPLAGITPPGGAGGPQGTEQPYPQAEDSVIPQSPIEDTGLDIRGTTDGGVELFGGSASVPLFDFARTLSNHLGQVAPGDRQSYLDNLRASNPQLHGIVMQFLTPQAQVPSDKLPPRREVAVI